MPLHSGELTGSGANEGGIAPENSRVDVNKSWSAVEGERTSVFPEISGLQIHEGPGGQPTTRDYRG